MLEAPINRAARRPWGYICESQATTAERLVCGRHWNADGTPEADLAFLIWRRFPERRLWNSARLHANRWAHLRKGLGSLGWHPA